MVRTIDNNKKKDLKLQQTFALTRKSTVKKKEEKSIASPPKITQN